MTKLHINKDIATVEDDGSLIAALLAGKKRKLIIKNPLLPGGKREITKVEKIAKVKEKKER